MDLECDLMDCNTPKHVVIFIWNQMLKFEVLQIIIMMYRSRTSIVIVNSCFKHKCII